MAVVGFDFGNQNCYVAVAKQGGIDIVANEYSLRNTPSCVSFGAASRTLGVAARQQISSNLKNTVLFIKHLIGRKYNDPIVQNELEYLPFTVTETAGHNIGIKVQYLGSDHIFTPEQILSMILLKLKTIAETYLQAKVIDCVISVPCYWTDYQRRALIQSAKIVHLNVLRIVNETTAVALNYGIYKQDLPAETEKAKTVVFVDVGHTSSQVSACSFNKGKLKMLGVAFEPNLGGRDIDTVLVNYFRNEFLKKYKVDANKSKRALIRLGDECEKVKKQMSANTNPIPLNIECFIDDKDVSAVIKRSDFEEMCSELWERLRALLLRLLHETKLKPADIDSVEVLGGSTRIPRIKQLVTDVIGKDTSTTLNADEAVSKGCALQCAILSPTFRVREFSITDVQPFAIKLCWNAEKGEDGEAVVFEEFHAIPFSKVMTFWRNSPFNLSASYMHPNAIPYNDTKIGQFKIQGVTPTEDNENRKVKVKIRIDPNGIFKIATAHYSEKIAIPPEELAPVEAMETTADSSPANPDAAKGEAISSDTMENDDQSNETSQDAPAPDSELKTEEAKPEEVKKEKFKVKSFDLPIDILVPEWTQKDVEKFQKIEADMTKQDELEKEKLDAKNEVEEYVYDMRDKIGTSLEQFIRPEDADTFRKQLTDTENWLYEDGEDEQSKVYKERLQDLKKWGDPVVERFREAEGRPLAFTQFGVVLQRTRKAYEAYVGKDVKYEHIDAADMEKVRKAVDEKQNWYETQLNQQNRRPLTEPPVVLVSQIQQEKEALERIVTPILNKPKPKVEPPPEIKKDKPAEKAPAEPSENGEAPPQQETQEASMEVD